MRKTVRIRKKKQSITKKGGGIFKRIDKKSKYNKLEKEKSGKEKYDKMIDFVVHHNKECRRFIYLLKSIILITQRTRKSYRNTINIMSGKEMYNHIKTSTVFNKIYSSMNPEQKESYNEYMELFLNMGHTILIGDYSFEKLKNLNAYTIIRNKQIYTDFLNYKKEVENLSMSDKTILNKIPPDESYYIPGDKPDKSKTDIYGNESITMKQKFEVLNIKFDLSSKSSELINSDNPLIKSANSETNAKSKVDKNTTSKNKGKVENVINETRKASYNKNSKSYVCGETNFELILPPTHQPSSTIIGKKNMVYYEIPIPRSTKPGSRIRFKQSPPPIPNIDNNTGKNPPNCPLKQTLSINHDPTSKEIRKNISKKINPTYNPIFGHTSVNTTKSYDKKSFLSRAIEKGEDLSFKYDMATGSRTYASTPSALWFSGVSSLGSSLFM